MKPLLIILALLIAIPANANETFGLGQPTKEVSTVAVETFGLGSVVIHEPIPLKIHVVTKKVPVAASVVIRAEPQPVFVPQSQVVCENGQCRVVNYPTTRTRIFRRR
jgi:hypothetical protein